MELNPCDVHIWSNSLAILPHEEEELFTLLSPEERLRANRFRLSHHKQRFIAAHGLLRRILCLYLNIPPQKINFAYTEHRKPYVFTQPSSRIQFNLAHSRDLAVYAVTLDHPIGIDIEKIKEVYPSDLSERYFHIDEKTYLNNLPPDERRAAFYQIWARKEAVVKAIGRGLTLPLSSFSVRSASSADVISLQNTDWSLRSLALFPGFASAIATNQVIQSLLYCHLAENGYKITKQVAN